MPDDEQTPKEEPCLIWESKFNRWQVESEDALTFVWLSDATFRRAISSEMIARGWSKKEVFLHCQKLSFWLEHESDPEVYVRRFGRAYLEHQRKQQEEDRHAR